MFTLPQLCDVVLALEHRNTVRSLCRSQFVFIPSYSFYPFHWCGVLAGKGFAQDPHFVICFWKKPTYDSPSHRLIIENGGMPRACGLELQLLFSTKGLLACGCKAAMS